MPRLLTPGSLHALSHRGSPPSRPAQGCGSCNSAPLREDEDTDVSDLLPSTKCTDPFRYSFIKGPLLSSANHNTSGRRETSELASGPRMCIYIVFIWLLLVLENSTKFLSFLGSPIWHHPSIVQKSREVSVSLTCSCVLISTVVCKVNDNGKKNNNPCALFT